MTNDDEIRWKVVRRMWRDKIIAPKGADADTVAGLAVPTHAEGRAKDLLRNEMSADPDCPVLKVTRGIVTLRDDKDAIRAYIERYGGQDALPFELK